MRANAVMIAAWIGLLTVSAFAGDSGGTGLGDAASGGTFDGGTATSVILGPDGSAAAPTYSFSSNPDTGISLVGDVMTFGDDGTAAFDLNTTYFSGVATQAGWMRSANSSSTNATVGPAANDLNTGLGWSGADCLTIVTGAVAAIDSCETAGSILTTFTDEVTITGVTGSGKAVCVKADGNLGVCADAVGAGGTCTCA